MKVHIKNVRVRHQESVHATAFSASLYLGSRKVGVVSCDGASAHLDYAVLPEHLASLHEHSQSLQMQNGHAMDLEWLILLEVRDQALLQEARKMAGGRVMFKTGEGVLMQSPKLSADERATYRLPKGASAITVDALHKHLIEVFEGSQSAVDIATKTSAPGAA